MLIRIVLSSVVLATLILVGAGTVEATGVETTQGWLVSVDETAGLIHLAMTRSDPSHTVAVSANKWVIAQCLTRLQTRRDYDVWMDVIICPGSGRACSYSYGLRMKG